jgi:4,5-dihydroxyphthalate decarboxylase
VADRLILRTALGKHDHVKPLKDGSIQFDRLRLEMVEFDPLPKAFRHMMRGGDLDVSEMALTTHLLAHHFRKPLTALPLPLWRRLHHSNLVCASGSMVAGPKDLEGKKVGVRAYTQTTGVWIRGILASQYGVDLNKITWVTMEDAHVAEYQDPPVVVRHTGGKTLRDLLLSGELAAIMGERDVDPNNIRPVIADADAAGEQWSRKTGIYPVNHVVAVRTELLQSHPWLGEELMRMFEAARVKAGARTLPYGLEPNRAAMQMLLDFAANQGLTPRTYRVDELFPKAA